MGRFRKSFVKISEINKSIHVDRKICIEIVKLRKFWTFYAIYHMIKWSFSLKLFSNVSPKLQIVS